MAKNYYEQARENSEENSTIVLLGNKEDLGHLRAVNTDDVNAFIDAQKISHFETSAKTNTNIENALQHLVETIHQTSPAVFPADAASATAMRMGKGDAPADDQCCLGKLLNS